MSFDAGLNRLLVAGQQKPSNTFEKANALARTREMQQRTQHYGDQLALGREKFAFEQNKYGDQQQRLNEGIAKFGALIDSMGAPQDDNDLQILEALQAQAATGDLSGALNNWIKVFNAHTGLEPIGSPLVADDGSATILVKDPSSPNGVREIPLSARGKSAQSSQPWIGTSTNAAGDVSVYGVNKLTGEPAFSNTFPGVGKPQSGMDITTADGTTISTNVGRGGADQPHKDYPRKVAAADATLIKDAHKKAGDVDDALVLVDAYERLMDSGYETGALAPVAGEISRYLATFGIAAEEAANFERSNALSKELGINMLKALGGNDTERELMTAIETAPNASNRPEVNRDIIERKRYALEIIKQRADFMSQWVERFGSLNTSSSEGTGFETAWRAFQLQKWREKFPPINNLSDLMPEASDVDDMIPRPQTIEEYNELPKGSLFIDPDSGEALIK